ncbi:MAG: type I secretion system permease/ATPase [Hyphomicrobiales bacterium]|nr:type I secretion system permease/ATPase [Hyphomicrobiales bacterium]
MASRPQQSEDRALPAVEATGHATSLPHMPDNVRQRLDAFAAPAAQADAAAPATTSTPPPSQPASATSRLPDIDRLIGRSELRQALDKSWRAVKAVGWFSCAINILMLTGPLFMLQVYDRVLTSGSIPTLLALSALTAALYAVIGVLELVRSRVIVRLGMEIDQRIGDRIFEASLRHSINGPGTSVGALRELDTLRNFVAGPAPMTAFDAAWTPIYLLVIFLTHWSLGLAAALGMALLVVCAWVSEQRGRGPLQETTKASLRSIEMAEVGQRNAAVLISMGMIGTYRARWQHLNQTALAWQVYASDQLGGIGAISKALRLLLQSLMLAIGAALAVKGEISAGAIVAGTIIFGRALAPVEQAIAHWRSAVKAYESYTHLDALLKVVPPDVARMDLPAPKGNIEVQGLRVAAPQGRQLILSGISFHVSPGQMLAVIGPSASGKSSLVRTLVGLWQPFAGHVKIDGVRLDQWTSERLGRHIGYLPQDVELFSGTVRDNIARFDTNATDDAVIAAAKAAHAHDLITALPRGYDTELGAFGTHLSAGQRQRIALARALYADPALVVLDEPNANLDRAGDEALSSAIDGMRRRGQAIIMVSHRVQAIGLADLVLYIDRGVKRAFGPRDQVLQAINGGGRAQSQQMPSEPQDAALAQERSA